MRVVKTLAFVVMTCGLLLHVYTVLFKAAGPFGSFLFGFLIWSWLPYFASLVLLLRWRNAYAALGAALLALAVDVFFFYTVFIRPRGSTAGVVLLVAPLLNLMLSVPLGALIGWLLSRMPGWVAAHRSSA